jgi:hypothetical protein
MDGSKSLLLRLPGPFDWAGKRDLIDALCQWRVGAIEALTAPLGRSVRGAQADRTTRLLAAEAKLEDAEAAAGRG